MIRGISQVLLEVEDQDRALSFWTDIMGFGLVQDAPYGDRGRWIEVRTPDRAVTVVLSLRHGEPPPLARRSRRQTSSSTATICRAPTRN